MARFEKGNKAGKGRKKGSKNKKTLIMEMFENIDFKALEKAEADLVERCYEWMDSKSPDMIKLGTDTLMKLLSMARPKEIMVEAKIEKDVTIKIDMSKF